MISLAFVLIERLWTWRPKQPVLRKGLLTDLVHLAFNGYFLSLLLAPVTGRCASLIDGQLVPLTGRDHVQALPLWAQLLIAFFLIDLIKWGIHLVLHSVPWLWTLHKVHHSIVEMDWIGNMRFHWLEIVLYNSTLYVPLLLLGFDFRVLTVMAIFSTLMGHFNHANLKLELGPLKYLLNHPGMHIWHHDAVLHGRAGCNYGINLSCWDWLFGTVYYPAGQPQRLGFKGIGRFPKNFVTLQLVPLSLLLGGRQGRGDSPHAKEHT